MVTRSYIDELLALVAQADKEGFGALYQNTSAKLFGVCFSVLKNEAMAEEALQEAYIKIWRGAGRYQAGQYSPMTWLITIARNAAIDRLRRIPAEQRRAQRPAPGTDAEDAVAAVPDSAPGPERLAVLASDMRLVTACMGELPDNRAQAIRGAYLEGLSYAELSTRFGVPLNTMRTWLRRGLIALRECMSR